MTAWGTAHIHFSACNVILMTFAILCLLSKVKRVWVHGEETIREHKVVLPVGAVCSALPSETKLKQSLAAVVLLKGADFQLQKRGNLGLKISRVLLAGCIHTVANLSSHMNSRNQLKQMKATQHMLSPHPLKAWGPPTASVVLKWTFLLLTFLWGSIL